MLTTIELCAGIAGFSTSHTRALAYFEIDPQCRAVLRRHNPGVLILNDVRDCGAHNLPRARVIKFGFPCQDLSVAGRRAGLAGARSGIFYECTRITNELQPDLAVWENVPGLLSSRSGRDFLAVLTELERIGYCGAWTTLDAQWFGVAQRRQRVFGVFARRDIGAAVCAEILSLAARMPGNTPQSRTERARVANAITASAGHHGWSGARGDGSDNLISFNMHSYAQDAAAASVGETLAAAHGVAITTVAFNFKGTYDAATEGMAPTITHGGQGGGTSRIAASTPAGIRRLTPREYERLQGFPDDWTAWGIDEAGHRIEMSDSARYRMLGNAVCRRVSAWIDRRIVEVLA